MEDPRTPESNPIEATKRKRAYRKGQLTKTQKRVNTLSGLVTPEVKRVELARIRQEYAKETQLLEQMQDYLEGLLEGKDEALRTEETERGLMDDSIRELDLSIGKLELR